MPWIYRVTGYHECESGMPEFLFLSRLDGSQEATYLRGLVEETPRKKRSGAPRRTTNQVRRKAKS
jgi:hypothetical protein